MTKSAYIIFKPELALRSGVKSQECDNGVCMKMWFKEKQGKRCLLFCQYFCISRPRHWSLYSSEKEIYFFIFVDY